jgi:hypothetical protein
VCVCVGVGGTWGCVGVGVALCVALEEADGAGKYEPLGAARR